MSALTFLRGLPASMIFLTRIPIPGRYVDADFRHASAFFSYVGLVVGGVGALVFTLARPLGAEIAACLSVAATVLVTGAMHEDGLADTADALFGAASRERVLAIAKDPRIGSFGATALVLVLLTRVACLASIPGRAVVAMIVAHSVSRFAATATMATLGYVQTDDSKSESVTGTGMTHVAIGAVAPLAMMIALLSVRAMSATTFGAVVLAATIVTSFLILWFRARVGGLLGDFLGATIALVDLGVLIAFVAVPV